MKNQLNTELLAELARLARRYPPEAWESLLYWLEDEAHRKQVVSLLSELARLSSRTPSRSRKPEIKASVPHVLADMQRTDGRKADLLQDFWRKLVAREVLPSQASIRSFAEMVGLRIPTSKKREQAVNDLVRQLIDLPYDDIQSALEKTAMTSRDFGQEYERWVNIILRRAKGGSGPGT